MILARSCNKRESVPDILGYLFRDQVKIVELHDLASGNLHTHEEISMD